jgi:hypothetical protein
MDTVGSIKSAWYDNSLCQAIAVSFGQSIRIVLGRDTRNTEDTCSPRCFLFCPGFPSHNNTNRRGSFQMDRLFAAYTRDRLGAFLISVQNLLTHGSIISRGSVL